MNVNLIFYNCVVVTWYALCGQVMSATIGFTPTTGENRFVDLLQQPDGTVFLNAEHKSFVKATQESDEYTLEFYIDVNDDSAPTTNGTIRADDSWFALEIELVNPSGNAVIERMFDPYKSIVEVDHYLLGRHILPPDQYRFTIGYSDNSCNMLGENCSNEASLEYKIRFRAIDTPILGDANLDGKVGFDDFLALSANFRGDLVYLDPWHSGDFNQSATTTIADFQILSANYGMTRELAPNAVPEPNSLFMVRFAALLVLMIRKRRC